MSGSDMKYKGRERNKRIKQTMTITIFPLYSYLLYYNKSNLLSII